MLQTLQYVDILIAHMKKFKYCSAIGCHIRDPYDYSALFVYTWQDLLRRVGY